MKKHSLIVGALILSLVIAPAYAADWTNTLGNGDINDAANWGARSPAMPQAKEQS